MPTKPTTNVPAGLAHRLRRADSPELLRLVTDHLSRFTMREVRQTLLNPYVSAEVIEEMLVNRRLLSSYDVRRAIARHRRTPEAAAMRFISGLFWRDLLEITLDVRLRPAVRRVAEKYLLQRLSRLTVGEKTSLARRAAGQIITQLRHDPNPCVIEALLENPRLTEELLTPLAAQSSRPRILDLVARDPAWGRRYEVRRALAKNPAAPFRAILPILGTLYRSDLEEIAADQHQSTVVRNRAAELLEAAEPPEGTGDGHARDD